MATGETGSEKSGRQPEVEVKKNRRERVRGPEWSAASHEKKSKSNW